MIENNVAHCRRVFRPHLQVILNKEQDIAFTASYMEFLTILSLIFNAVFLYVVHRATTSIRSNLLNELDALTC